MINSSPTPGSQMPGMFPETDDIPSPALPENEARGLQPPRRTSFNFLRRGKSMERVRSGRSVSGGKLSKKQIVQSKEQDLLQQQREAANIPKPMLPDIARAPKLQTFGGEDARPDSVAIVSNKMDGYSTGRSLPSGVVDMTRSNVPYNIPLPPMPGNKKGDYVDPYARTESMTHRGRNSYASSGVSTINSPRRVRRRKDPTPFNILVVGARNSGKTSFIEFLRTSLALPPRKQRPSTRDDHLDMPQHTSSRVLPNFTSHYLETEMDDGERIGLTLWDSEGLDKSLVDLQLRDMSSFLESKFEDTFNEETKVIRSPGVRDTHIHCVILVLDPLRLDVNINAAKKAQERMNGSFTNGKSYIQPPTPSHLGVLEENLDFQVLRALQGKTTVVPVISKADTVTVAHMTHLKRAVWNSLKKANLDPLEAMGLDDEEDDNDTSSSDNNTPIKTKHNSTRFDERDEDEEYLRSSPSGPSTHTRRHSSQTSRLDSSSSSPSPSRANHASSRPDNHSHLSSSNFPLPPSSSTQTPSLPLSILSPDPATPEIVGRQFAWGMADPYNTAHCDFVKLKEKIFGEWRGELREASRELWYEGWRSEKLRWRGGNGNGREGKREEVGVAR